MLRVQTLLSATHTSSCRSSGMDRRFGATMCVAAGRDKLWSVGGRGLCGCVGSAGLATSTSAVPRLSTQNFYSPPVRSLTGENNAPMDERTTRTSSPRSAKAHASIRQLGQPTMTPTGRRSSLAYTAAALKACASSVGRSQWHHMFRFLVDVVVVQAPTASYDSLRASVCGATSAGLQSMLGLVFRNHGAV